ncbi:MAG: hypothetical protein CMH52_10690 [Myxococcales bacterium]|nr:hypothetical protein [Myxococcales bacterium]
MLSSIPEAIKFGPRRVAFLSIGSNCSLNGRGLTTAMRTVYLVLGLKPRIHHAKPSVTIR